MSVHTLFSAFRSNARDGSAWAFVGLASSFPNVTPEDGKVAVSEARPCTVGVVPGCKVFRIPKEDSSRATEVQLEGDNSSYETGGLKDQVLVFKFDNKFHAVDHQCPHSSYPLSNGTPFDIEDFGMVLSAGLTCPKHGWSFDLFTGMGDRGNYRLGVWEVQLREPRKTANESAGNEGDANEDDKEVWVRRKQRIG